MNAGLVDPSQHLWWLASRSFGVVAMVLISLSVGLGLALSGRLLSRRGMPARVKTFHEAFAISGLVAIVMHGLLLIGDPYLHPGLAGVALPFALAGQSIWTAIGIIAGWLAAIVTLSFYVRRWIGISVWRWLHRWTLAVYVLGIAHTLGSGTDARTTWLLVILGASAAPVIFAGVHRLLPRAHSEPNIQPQGSRLPLGSA